MGYSLEGIGMARPAVSHQQFARNIVINFYLLTKFEKFEAFQEGTANNKPTCEKVPDITFVDIETEKVLVSVEIEKIWSGATIWKIENELIKKYKHQEVFLYNYRKNLWRKYYKKGKEILFAETAYSAVLQINLADLLALNK